VQFIYLFNGSTRKDFQSNSITKKNFFIKGKVSFVKKLDGFRIAINRLQFFHKFIVLFKKAEYLFHYPVISLNNPF
jgi:hypothetical protein